MSEQNNDESAQNVKPELIQRVSVQGLEQVDQGMFDLFNEKLNIEVVDDNGIRPINVIFASGERWAQVRDRTALRDDNGALVLPLVTIRRTAIDRTHPPGQATVAQEAPYIVVTKKLNEKTPLLRSAISKRRYPKNSQAPVAPIYDIITIPYPDPIRITYDVKVWAQYHTHMNQMLEKVFNNFSFGETFKLELADGFYCITQLQPNVGATDNFEEFTDDERIIRYTMNFITHVSLVIQNDNDETFVGADIGGTGKRIKRVLQNPAQIKLKTKEMSVDETSLIDLMDTLNLNPRVRASLLKLIR